MGVKVSFKLSKANLHSNEFPHSTVQVVSKLHATVLGKSCVVEIGFKNLKNFLQILQNLLMQNFYCDHRNFDSVKSRGGKNRRAREHCSQEMLNSCKIKHTTRLR